MNSKDGAGTGPGRAGQGGAWRGWDGAGQGRTGQGRAGQGRAWAGRGRGWGGPWDHGCLRLGGIRFSTSFPVLTDVHSNPQAGDPGSGQPPGRADLLAHRVVQFDAWQGPRLGPGVHLNSGGCIHALKGLIKEGRAGPGRGPGPGRAGWRGGGPGGGGAGRAGRGAGKRTVDVDGTYLYTRRGVCWQIKRTHFEPDLWAKREGVWAKRQGVWAKVKIGGQKVKIGS